MAAFFNVSESAVSQRIKRLKSAQVPESFENLTDKEKKFVLGRLEGKSNTAAALQAYDCGSLESAKTIGKKLSHDPDVEMAITHLMHQEGIGRRERARRLRDVINAADLGIVSKGLDMANKLSGDYAPDKIEVSSRIAETTQMIATMKEYMRLKEIKIKEEAEAEIVDISGVDAPLSIENISDN
jgi:DNA-binding Lrp family transcriptional regulator